MSHTPSADSEFWQELDEALRAEPGDLVEWPRWYTGSLRTRYADEQQAGGVLVGEG
jgi:hypothetical protein